MGMAVSGLVGFVAGNFSPLRGKKSKQSQKELERLYQILSAKNVEIQKLKTMVYEYEYRNQELKQALYESEQESLKRDYEEFKQPDANGDDVISRAEFATYIHNYMKVRGKLVLALVGISAFCSFMLNLLIVFCCHQAYPHIPKEEYPTFEDFDMNRDGLVTFQEWQEYLYQQQLAEKPAAQAGGARGGAAAKQNAAVPRNHPQTFQYLAFPVRHF